MSERKRHFDSYAEAREHLAELETLFDLRWAADMRAIKKWQEAHPDRKNVWPDHADLVVWLMERLDGHALREPDKAALAEAVSDALAAATEGTEWAEAPEPSDEPGSPYVVRLTNELAARGVVRIGRT